MGLAGPRKRVKLSHDPNNTKWTRDTTGFGHKIMASQGWQPGEILGAKDAPHAEFHTAANASHIRVVLKDDNLGLGAKRGSGLAQGECTGLDVFQTLLGRLNGKDEDELEKEQKSREDLKRAIYTEQRWGSIRFVKGGFLVGDKIQELVDMEEKRIRQLVLEPLSTAVQAAESNASQGSKSETDEALDTKSQKKRRKEERKKLRSAEIESEERSVQEEPQEAVPSTARKAKKKRKEGNESVEAANIPIKTEGEINRKSKKKKRRVVAEPKKAVPVQSDTADHLTRSQSESRTTSPERPAANAQSLLVGRHAVRSRNIAQKRLAVMDTASLNQIFMIKQQI